ncbi:lysine-rich arabinogalactan protein 19-like [Schistocerca americana]|uniref:lysine-rich arabinogalactan protein 19-like n=1 Tax=Schistocerca americana TaxID=7009 RepID=UPI001F4F7122|nr:lysine-rich arabinogalactan protein 19-like [Schistocerca americana]
MHRANYASIWKRGVCLAGEKASVGPAGHCHTPRSPPAPGRARAVRMRRQPVSEAARTKRMTGGASSSCVACLTYVRQSPMRRRAERGAHSATPSRPAQLPREAVDNTTYAGAVVGPPSLAPPYRQASAAPAAVAPVSDNVTPPTVVVPPVVSEQSLPAERTPREVSIADLPAVSVPDVHVGESSEMLVESPRPISVPAPPTDKRKLQSQPGLSTSGEADASSAESEVSQVSTQSAPADPKPKRRRSEKRSKTAPTEGDGVSFEQAVEGLTDSLVQGRRDAPFVHGPPVSVPATPASRAVPDAAPPPSDTMQWSEDVEEDHFF